MKSITRSAEADWKGNLEQGHGLVTTGSEALLIQPFSFGKRTEQGDRSATNPEELIAAGLASCFGMALSKTLEEDGAVSPQIVIKADVTLNLTDDGPKVNELKLNIAAMIPDYSQERLEKAVSETQKGCPVYKLLEKGWEKTNVEVVLNK